LLRGSLLVVRVDEGSAPRGRRWGAGRDQVRCRPIASEAKSIAWLRDFGKPQTDKRCHDKGNSGRCEGDAGHRTKLPVASPPRTERRVSIPAASSKARKPASCRSSSRARWSL